MILKELRTTIIEGPVCKEKRIGFFEGFGDMI